MQKFNKLILSTLLGAAVLVTGCASWTQGDSERSAGRIVDDKRITSSVEEGLSREPVYKFSDVDVKTFNGVVQLSGFVRTDEQKQRAGEIAQQVQGVARVVNSIALKPELAPTGRPDGTNNLNQPNPASTNR